MDLKQRNVLLASLDRWVDTHPHRESPTLAFLGRSYTPEEIFEEVNNATEFGESLGDFLFEAATRYRTSVEELIHRAIEANQRTRE
jgi:hypothetical protein